MQKRLQDADAHFAPPEKTEEKQRFLNSKELLPFTYGLRLTGGQYERIPEATALATSRQVHDLFRNTSGGRLKFMSDTKSLTLRFSIPPMPDQERPAYLWTAGFDLYEREEGTWRYLGRSFMPGNAESEGKEYRIDLIAFKEKRMRELLIHFPLYAQVMNFALGIDEEAVIGPAPYPDMAKGPVVFYGSSITQGGCASRPGMAYPAILSRRLDFDFLNLGFSDGARVEQPMLDYLSSLPMRVLVYDYDHNAPTTEFLEETHEAAFLALRRRMPDLPVIIASAPFAVLRDMWVPRHEIIYRTYKNAREAGDTHVYYVDGNAMYNRQWMEDCTADATHPNDAGFLCMADSFEPVLREILGSR